MMVKRIPQEQKQRIVHLLQSFFQEERGEEVGFFEAEEIVDLVVKETAPFFYNQAIQDVRKIYQEQISRFDDELYALERPIRE